MENYIMFEGKKISLTDEQINILGVVKEAKKDPFERQDTKSIYYYINAQSEVYQDEDYDFTLDKLRFNIANYCADKELMEQRALHEILNRLLWRRSMQDGEDKRPWDTETKHYSIEYDCFYNRLFVYKSRSIKNTMTPYFTSYESAEHAIEDIVEPFMKEHPEFVW